MERDLMPMKGTVVLGGIINPWEIVVWFVGLLVIVLIDKAKEQRRRLLVLDRIQASGAWSGICDSIDQLELFDKSADEDLMPETKPDAAWWSPETGDTPGWLRKSA